MSKAHFISGEHFCVAYLDVFMSELMDYSAHMGCRGPELRAT